MVVTTGTFLRGVIHIGDRKIEGGRMGSKASTRLAVRFDALGAPLGRLKTGTPPRLESSTIDWERLDRQEGDDEPTLFSFLSKSVSARQIACGITHTNEKTHDIIRANLERSAMYGGHIDGVGPRYCPSIEDKVVRFAEKNSHQIFLEPEGLSRSTVYPNGISTSLPEDVQISYVQSISGLERAQITTPGYAIEYDYVDPRALDRSLAFQGVEGLFLAGQINGTTGYEEAGAQGLVAGLNAARRSKSCDPVIFQRSESYIGVMIDDLVLRGVTEPYRMFTSRAEFRLSLRADNADQRLTPLGVSIGVVGEKRRAVFERKMEQLSGARATLSNMHWTPREIAEVGIKISNDGARRNGLQLLSFKDVFFDHLIDLDSELATTPREVQQQLKRDATYMNYLDRQQRDVDALARDEAITIPKDLDFDSLGGLSYELCSKLKRLKPDSMAQAARIDGMTPAALVIILSAVRAHQRGVAV